MSSRNKLLIALSETQRKSEFECPRTGIDLVAMMPRRIDIIGAEKAARDEWSDQEVTTSLILLDYTNTQREHLLARVILQNGDPIGIDVVREIDSDTLAVYDDIVKSLEVSDPDVDDWTQDQWSTLIEDVKKKDPRTEALLKQSGQEMLLRFIRIMADRL